MSAEPVPLPPAYVDECAPRGAAALRRAATLARHLAARQLVERHRGSALGFAWTFLHPLLMMLVYTFVFRHVLRVSVEGVPYTVFFLTNYLAWVLFSRAVVHAGSSLLEGAHLLRRARLPQAVLPVSAVLAHTVHYLLALPVLLVFNAALGILPGWGFGLLALAVPLLALQALAVGLVVAALAPRFRDVLPLTEVLLTAWFFLVPAVYPFAYVEGSLSPPLLALYEANPVVGSLGLVQAAFLRQPVLERALVLSLVTTPVALALAFALFQRRARDVAELL